LKIECIEFALLLVKVLSDLGIAIVVDFFILGNLLVDDVDDSSLKVLFCIRKIMLVSRNDNMPLYGTINWSAW
jgi:hypothetical protein